MSVLRFSVKITDDLEAPCHSAKTTLTVVEKMAPTIGLGLTIGLSLITSSIARRDSKFGWRRSLLSGLSFP